MKTRENDVVAEYLREVDQRLAGIPVLQRRELLNDLAAHIAAEQAERNLSSEGEIIEVLERLGSPEVVAAAAHEEAGTRFTPPVAPGRGKLWLILGIAAAVVLVLGFCAFFALASGDSSVEGPAQPAATAPPAPEAS
ncbi:DUF1700 domain-containing protein [Paractinoplanes hotanensis]|uniref:DUF1700 domain-containing protein n=1 Tax=Paractinoplanes hotanensis TaxID=2906497 RepID=A0ABT0Y1N8_9ACTN|nr:DUF1700 domain-containing protein [Actinoplanes hotanensis]MCM4079412.1 DUF1700 domain-containing protein [Actinoplanes hotanensis]